MESKGSRYRKLVERCAEASHGRKFRKSAARPLADNSQGRLRGNGPCRNMAESPTPHRRQHHHQQDEDRNREAVRRHDSARQHRNIQKDLARHLECYFGAVFETQKALDHIHQDIYNYKLPSGPHYFWTTAYSEQQKLLHETRMHGQEIERRFDL